MSARRPVLLRDLPSLDATRALAEAVADLLRPGDGVLLAGPLGAGKSEFARALIRRLAADPALEVPSPSYTLLQTYPTRLGPVHHFDLWRLDGPGPLAELGWEAARADIVVVEWPDRLGGLSPPDALCVELHPSGANSRRAVVSGWPERIGRIA